MNIFETFETFLKEPLSILKRNFVQIVNMQTENIYSHKSVACNANLLKNGTQITVINNDKMYNLLSLVMLRARNKDYTKEIENLK